MKDFIGGDFASLDNILFHDKFMTFRKHDQRISFSTTIQIYL
jgi:hypothetical protein